MVLRPKWRHVAAFAATLAVALAQEGCSRVLDRRAPAVGALHPARGRPAALTGVYEHAPTTAWQRHATARPATPALSLSRGVIAPTSCLAVPRGLPLVLPVRGGESVTLFRSYGVGVAGDPVAAAHDLLSRDGLGMAQAAIGRTADVATYGQECALDLFAYVALAGPGALSPVVVR